LRQAHASEVTCDGKKQDVPPPPRNVVDSRSAMLEGILRPKRKTGNGYRDNHLSPSYRARLEALLMFLRLFAKADYQGWMKASELAAAASGKGPWLARRLREWAHALARNENDLPTHLYGQWNSSILDDEDLQHQILLHLQELPTAPYICAGDIIKFLATDEMKSRFKLKKNISERTAQRWMKRLDFRWTKEPKGQYTDGHEREDVVRYRQSIFLPRMRVLWPRMRKWANDGSEDKSGLIIIGKIIVLWAHDESIFYANDRRKLRWVHKAETAKPFVKGEGVSLMIADYVSADYGWLRSEDGCVLQTES
jgi:hypothetical protein